MIEDVVPLHGVAVSVREDEPVSGVRTVPQGERLDLRRDGGRIRFEVPRLEGHQMLELALR